MLRRDDRRTGKNLGATDTGHGEQRREATRQRELREVQAALRKGYRNQQTDNFFKR